jgi:hypothetical protein
LNNIGLKTLSLILAFITLVYVAETIKTDSGDSTVLQKLFMGSGYITKELAVKPVFLGEVPKGYKFIEEDVRVFPESVVLIGPTRFLSDKKFIYTKPISLSEHTKTKNLNIELESVSRSIKSQEVKAQVFLPIKKTSKGKPSK